jgi:branched-chain amino acid aminotransferase
MLKNNYRFPALVFAFLGLSSSIVYGNAYEKFGFKWHDRPEFCKEDELCLERIKKLREKNECNDCLFVGLDIFEGTKAYRRPDGHINLFRVDRNMARLNRSAVRLGMPEIDPATHINYIESLVKLEHEWVPRLPNCTLYIRPVVISTEETLEVRIGREFLHYIFLSPVGPYFANGFNPVAVHISHEYVRAVKGGTGEAKTTGNYAGTVAVAEQVRQHGYQQVLWLDAIERRYVEEVGAMNIMFVRDGKHIVTPALSGSILHGVTRESVLQLAPDLGYTVSEERLDVDLSQPPPLLKARQ